MNRRRFLLLAGPFGGSIAAGCLEAPTLDGGDSESEGGADAETADSDRQLQPLAGDGGGVYGDANGVAVDTAALLRSPADLDSVLPVFDEDDRDAVSTYVEETDFDREALVMYATSVPTSAYTLVFDDATVENERVVAEFSSEQESGLALQAVNFVVALKRIEVADPPPSLVVERGDETVSNRYEIRLEQRPEDELDERLAVATVSELPADVRSPVRSAIEDGATALETISEPLARAVADHTYVRDGDAYYELSGDLPEHVLTAEIHGTESVDAEPGDDAVLDLRELRDESEVASDLVTTAMSDDDARRVALPPALERTLEEYDYVWRKPTFVELSVTVDDPGAPYEFRATPVPRMDVLSDLGETGSIVTYGDLSDAAQSEIDAALETLHEVTNPPALFETHPPGLRATHTPSLVVDGVVYQPVITDVVGEPPWQQ